ncbi:MAG: M10 family metallopeptidase C-terminal domain-containing protein, partial [Alphaproteobacteria bacterium]|nr:M10 family metallopeptidase C-terminal domain-containing protein [Alphaproteobacteria bacterium]
MPTITGTSGSNTLVGTDGDDVIDGLGGGDTINGGGGADHIIGGSGDDTLTGGAGADTFAYVDRRFGDDTITDFSAGDRIDLSALNIASIEDLRPFIRQDGPDAVIDLRFAGNSEAIRITNVSAQSLSNANFV